MDELNRAEQQKRARQRAFLTAFQETGNISHAADAADVSRSTHYLWMREDEDYVTEFRYAEERAADALEAEARRRAVEGVCEPVGWYQGSPGGYVQRYSDTLLIFLLKGAKPEKYKDRHEHSGPNGQPLFKSYIGFDPQTDL